jgi:Na+-transporting NADH:ubiquinone oxidoreductase subunit NqrB
MGKICPAFNALDTFLFVPNHTTKHGAHIRDAVDLKRTNDYCHSSVTASIILWYL